MGKKLLKNIEWSILIVSIILCVIGAIALFSATQNTEYDEFKKQLIFIGISIPFLILASIIDYNVIVKFSTLAYIILLALLIRCAIYRTYKWGFKLVQNNRIDIFSAI